MIIIIVVVVSSISNISISKGGMGKKRRIVIEPEEGVTVRVPKEGAESPSVRDTHTLCHQLQYLTCQLPHCPCVFTHTTPAMYVQIHHIHKSKYINL